MGFYRNILANSGIPYVIFGHIGDNHLHINLLPEVSQKKIAASVYDEIANKIFSWNGTISAEHGIGKIKKKYFYQMLGQNNIQDLKRIKNKFDPQQRLGRDNIF